MPELVRTIAWRPGNDPEPLLTREWLVTNGYGGYASGTLAGVLTRRYHGLLIAALSTPFGRRVMLSKIYERVRFPNGQVVDFGADERSRGGLELHGPKYLTEFLLEKGLPVWRYEVEGSTIEKRVLLLNRQNTAYITYSLAGGEGAIRLELRPAMHFRSHDAPVNQRIESPYEITVVDDQFEFCVREEGCPPLRALLYGDEPAFTWDRRVIEHVLYRLERNRGYEAEGSLWSPGYFHATLSKGSDVSLVASTEQWESIRALPPSEALNAERNRRDDTIEAALPAAREGPAAELVLAADQFIITPVGRVEDAARAHATGAEVRSVIAGYHWFTDWGRDTMISLEGLTLVTGRAAEAGWIIRTFSHYIQDGLLPNMFPEGERAGLYHTADATMWYFHAIDRYLHYTNDRATLKHLLPKLIDIIDHHLAGTRFRIHVDQSDGLVSQGQEGLQLTWMDAKVGDWVVTPRRGKAVEINALWYNALCLMQKWVTEEQGPAEAARFGECADRARESFNRRFWNEERGYLFDVVDGESGDDPSCRPNQVLAISLPHPVLDRGYWEPVMGVVAERLLTPVGLRSLAPGEPDYKPRYYGDLRARDAAYHQGTVWGWLIGAYVDAWLKMHPKERRRARKFLLGFIPEMGEFGLGTVAEVFDADPPFTPRGCIAQAWSVAELLRSWVLTGEEEPV